MVNIYVWGLIQIELKIIVKFIQFMKMAELIVYNVIFILLINTSWNTLNHHLLYTWAFRIEIPCGQICCIAINSRNIFSYNFVNAVFGQLLPPPDARKVPFWLSSWKENIINLLTTIKIIRTSRIRLIQSTEMMASGFIGIPKLEQQILILDISLKNCKAS